MTMRADGFEERQADEVAALPTWSATLPGLARSWRKALTFTPAVISRFLLAFVLAVALWAYVTAQKNPVMTISLSTISITPRGLPRGYVLSRPLPYLSVKLQGLADDLSGVTASSIVATVDARGLTPNSPPRVLPVSVTAPGGHNLTLLDPSPLRVQVTVDNIASRSVAVVVVPIGQPPAGYSHTGFDQVDPQSVTVTGLSSVLDRVRSATVEVDLSNAAKPIEEARAPVLLDASGHPINASSLVVTPAVVQVSVPMVPQVSFRSIAVVPIRIGPPRSGYTLVGLSVFPPSVSAYGQPATMATLNTLPTDAIDLSGLAGPTVVSTTVRPPLNVVISSSQVVTVALDIQPITTTADLPLLITVRGLPQGWKATVQPAQAVARVVGPAAVLATMVLPSLSLDVAGHAPGRYAQALSLRLPKRGPRLLGLSPDHVMVTLSPPKAKG